MKRHGMYKTATYSTWRAMINRCTYESNKRFSRYGGRGIKVCKRWLGEGGFENFLSDMGERPAGLTLGRLHSDRGYSPKNCEWQTVTKQNRDRSNTHKLTFKGETLTAKEWSVKLGIDYRNMRRRIKRGLPVARILLQEAA